MCIPIRCPQKLRAELDATKNLAIKAGKIVFIAGVGFVVTYGTGGVGLIPYVSGLAASTGAAIVLDGQVQHKIAIGDYSGAVDQATYHLPGLGSSRSLVEALIEGNTLGALVSAGSVGLDVMPFIKIGKLPGSKADALGLANKTGSGAQQQRLAATTNGKGNGNHGQRSNPNKKNPAERPKGGRKGKNGNFPTIDPQNQQGPLGTSGTRTESHHTWKNKETGERIDVENPAPGKRPGQIHYHDAKGNKYHYDPETGIFYNTQTGRPLSNKEVKKLSKNEGFIKGILKAFRVLGSKEE